MPKLKAVFRCQQCAYTSLKWLGQCPDCGEWNSLIEEVEEVLTRVPSKGAAWTSLSSEVTSLKEVAAKQDPRVATGMLEMDRLLGEGLVAGQVLLLAGPPGIGKSTLLLQLAAGLSERGMRSLYVSGEESLSQISRRAHRLGLKAPKLSLVSETNLEKILKTLDTVKPQLVVVDSIQTVYHPEMSGAAGSVGQVRACAGELLSAAKNSGAVLFLLGHVTKEGVLAGPKILEHMVDTVLYFDTERENPIRVLRAYKNRFGPTSEIGLFEMKESGLMSVTDATALFLGDSRGAAPQPGQAISVAMEGTRPIVVEVQALVSPSRFPYPRRAVTGADLNRSLVLLAALEKHLKLPLDNRDVYINLAGGVRMRDPGVDLAMVLAVAGSAKDLAVDPHWVFVGEVGLLGELRRAPFLSERLREAERIGFTKALVSQKALEGLPKFEKLQVWGVERIWEALKVVGLSARPASPVHRAVPD
ncbi:MAG: DNA repair protein RadA [Elusimicrobia bacterium RIFCSPLOWO2_12_FULL_59_9]|nr:MAG: DNA repair protein RadA [Elusimicrobia bacterium RIFCSPLOWO2_12_FULL_59_9]